MSCSRPNIALIIGYKEDGTSILRFKGSFKSGSGYCPGIEELEEKYGKDSICLIPCGKCDSCIESKMKEWSLRCYFESLDHSENCFVTLTYDKDHLPDKLSKSDLQDFIKSLRNNGIKVRYFGCGEYGSNGRPHYHICLFGYFPSDTKVIGKSSKGFYMLKSKFLDNLWAKGLVTIQEFTPETAGYCAGYCLKKDPENRSFQLMSKKPGLGKNYFLSNHNGNDTIIGPNGFVTNLPRYFLSLLDKDTQDGIKLYRREKVSLSLNSELLNRDLTRREELFNVHEELMINKIQKYKRSSL